MSLLLCGRIAHAVRGLKSFKFYSKRRIISRIAHAVRGLKYQIDKRLWDAAVGRIAHAVRGLK